MFRKNVPLKKVNSKYILKSTLTPKLARKQFQKNTTGLERSRSWSSLDNANSSEQDFSSQNYLTVHVSMFCKKIAKKIKYSKDIICSYYNFYYRVFQVLLTFLLLKLKKIKIKNVLLEAL